jgi:hypothetical protein
MMAIGTLMLAALQFAWPQGEAQVELTDERMVGDESRTIVMSMRLRVEPDAAPDRTVVRISDARIVSIDGAGPEDDDPIRTQLAVARVMKCVTPTMIIGRDGRYIETRDVDRLARDVVRAAGLPSLPVGLDALSRMLSDVAAEDWGTWVGAWIGESLAPGESNTSERTMEIRGARVPVRLTRRGLAPSAPEGRTRLEASAVYPSEAVRQYTTGFLIDLAREAKELGDDPVASVRFAESARYGPLTETLSVELETATMRPLFAERTRSFSAGQGKHKVDGRERRAHRFTWTEAATSTPPASTDRKN